MRGIGRRIGAGGCRKWGRLAEGSRPCRFKSIASLISAFYDRNNGQNRHNRYSGYALKRGGRCEPDDQVGWEGCGG